LKEGITHIEDNLTKKAHLVHFYFCLLLFTTTIAGFSSKRSFCLKLIDNLGYSNFKDSKPFFVQLALIESIMKITHKGVDGSYLITQLGQTINKNMVNLLPSFEELAEEYKNVYLHW
jgi:hypothetical protein